MKPERQAKSKERAKAQEVLFRFLDQERAIQLETCVRCGLCAESCHYYLADGETRSIPGYKVGLVQRVWQRYSRPQGRY